jgi:hypothetical protein
MLAYSGESFLAAGGALEGVEGEAADAAGGGVDALAAEQDDVVQRALARMPVR